MRCYVCGFDAGYNEIGSHRFTCPECAPGTTRWAEWYQRSGRHSEAGDILFAWVLRKSKAVAVLLAGVWVLGCTTIMEAPGCYAEITTLPGMEEQFGPEGCHLHVNQPLVRGRRLVPSREGHVMSSNISVASHEWATRPDDQRYLSLADLKAAVSQRRRESWTVEGRPGELGIVPSEGNRLAVKVYDRTTAQDRFLAPTHFAFGQLASYAQAPGSYLRTLPSDLAAINLQWGLEHNPVRDNVLTLAQSNSDDKLRAMTSTSYGRIWDEQVVNAVERVNSDGRWVVPAASYTASNPKRATTLYASDRDVFLFLVDPAHPIDVGGDTLYRGFYTWNSEVGTAVFGLATFLYRYVCDNRIIWGATNVQELRIRHTGGAPDRFAYEGARYLRRYAEESPAILEGQIRKARSYELLTSAAEDRKGGKPEDRWTAWLKARGFTDSLAKNSVAAAQAEQGDARSLWDIVQGVTAFARSIQHTDERVRVEALAGRLMQTVA